MRDSAEVACKRSRAKVQINTHGGRVTGYARNRTVPVVYAIAPRGGDIWPVREVIEVMGGVRQQLRTSVIEGCTVIWS
ncbi:hypothetical protein PRCB_02930 [Pantoea rodasii]|uniref:Uncharacterized protein n=1 Tax=Pantoea rodasii TaxID=1076549 RepID=A0A2M9WHG3_9GAMM|nr:hypothetical protein PRCB_02930 [Pantoea rodasii]